MSLTLHFPRVPEIGENGDGSSNLSKPDGLPEFTHITVEKCLAAIGTEARSVEKLVEETEQLVQSKDQLNVYADILDPFEHAIKDLETTWGVAKALYLGSSTLMPTTYYLNIHERAQRARAARFNSKPIFDCLSTADPKSVEAGSPEGKQLVKKYLLEGRLNGITLQPDERLNLTQTLTELNKEKSTYRSKVETAIKQFSHVIKDYSLVRAFPPTLLEAIAVNDEEPTKGPWKVTLQPDIVKGVLEYCPDRVERWNVWQADVRKASSHTEKSLATSTHLENIRSLRKRQANLLGFPDFATMSMETKMAKDVPYVREILNSLLSYAFPAQVQEVETLQKFADESNFGHKLELCDILYWKRKHLNAVYNYDEERIREYFPLPRVITGIFHLLEKLFHVTIVERENVEAWHPSVKYYDVFNEGNQSELLGGFYLDCYSQKGRRGKEGWMVAIRNRSDVTQTKPLCSLVFNFPTPVYGKPSLLSIDDMGTIFRNFGKCMQHILTQVRYSDLAGLSNIEWDAAEVCGKVMEFFLKDPNVLVNLSGHYSTEEEIPAELLDSIKIYQNYMAGYDLCKELYIANLDLELHSSNDFWQDIVRKLWPNYINFELDKKDSHPCSMVNIFAGEWGAAYFSHIMSKIVAADVYSTFVENGRTDVGQRLKSTFFAYGGSVGTAEIFRRFRGRDLSPDALIGTLQLNRVNERS